MAMKIIETPSGPVTIYTTDEESGGVTTIPERNPKGVTRGSEIKPSGYFTTDPSIGGGSGAMRELLDPMDPAGAYRAFLNSRLFPTDIGNYENITSSGALASGPFNLIPTGEGMVTAAAGAVNPIVGGLTRGAISARNAEALETLANQGILERITPALEATGLRKALNYEFMPNTGQYRLSADTEAAIKESGSSPQEYFESQYKEKFGQANELAQYLDQIAYTTKGNFFSKDFFGNPTPWSKYVDRSGNIRPDALQNWEKFGQKDKMGALSPFFDDEGEFKGKDMISKLTGSDKRDKSDKQPPVANPGGIGGLDAFGQPKRFDDKGRRLAGGSKTNLLQG